MDNFSDILNNAMQISAMLGGMNNEQASDGFEENTGAIDNLSNMLNMIDVMKSLQSVGKNTHEPAQTSALPYDGIQPGEALLPNNIKVMTAIAPYMGEANRRNIIIASKLMELMYLVNNLDSDMPVESQESRASIHMDGRNMLQAARPYVDRDKREMVDLLITVMDISEILEKVERMNTNNAGRN